MFVTMKYTVKLLKSQSQTVADVISSWSFNGQIQQEKMGKKRREKLLSDTVPPSTDGRDSYDCHESLGLIRIIG